MLKHKAKQNCRDILIQNFKVTKENKILIIYDDNSKLNNILKTGYVDALKDLNYEFESFNFYDLEEPEVRNKIDNLKPKDLVVLIQTSSFRLSKYRWRNLLFQLNLKVIEHPHLEKNLEEEYETYIDSLKCDLDYYKQAYSFLKEKLEKANGVKLISSKGDVLEFKGKLDKVYDNIGNFEDKNNWGARFPIGEVFTESLNLEDLEGDCLITAFPDLNHYTNLCESFKCRIKTGVMVSHEGPKEFDEIFKLIEEENQEKQVFVREFGLGLNRNIKGKLRDISSYERREGVHFSLGMKHGIYQKKLWPKYGKKFYQRYHIDIFVDVEKILVDDIEIFDLNEGYLV